MANSNGIIQAPVRVREDVAVVLGVASGDVGVLCSNQHGKINIWSECKPVKNKGYFYADRYATERYTHPFEGYVYNFYWWLGEVKFSTITSTSGGLTYRSIQFCGMNVPCLNEILDASNIAFFIDNMVARGFNWPAIIGMSIFRLSDFNGYSHTAKPNFYIHIAEKIFQGDGTRFGFKFNDFQENGGINLTNTALFENFYPGVAMDGQLYIVEHANIGSGEINYNTSNILSQAQRKAYKFITNNNGDTWIPLPHLPQYGKDYENPVEVSFYTAGDSANNPAVNGKLWLGYEYVSPSWSYANLSGSEAAGKTRSITPDYSATLMWNPNSLSPGYPGGGDVDWCVALNGNTESTMRHPVVVWRIINTTKESISIRISDLSISYEEQSYGKATIKYIDWREWGSGLLLNKNDMIEIGDQSDYYLATELHFDNLDFPDTIYYGKLELRHKGSRFSHIIPSTWENTWDGDDWIAPNYWSDGWVQLNLWTGNAPSDGWYIASEEQTMP